MAFANHQSLLWIRTTIAEAPTSSAAARPACAMGAGTARIGLKGNLAEQRRARAAHTHRRRHAMEWVHASLPLVSHVEMQFAMEPRAARPAQLPRIARQAPTATLTPTNVQRRNPWAPTVRIHLNVQWAFARIWSAAIRNVTVYAKVATKLAQRGPAARSSIRPTHSAPGYAMPMVTARATEVSCAPPLRLDVPQAQHVLPTVCAVIGPARGLVKRVTFKASWGLAQMWHRGRLTVSTPVAEATPL